MKDVVSKRESLNELGLKILKASISVHSEMGPGLLESVYQHCMVRELQLKGVSVAQTVPVPLSYKGEPLNKDYIIDLLVEEEIIIELKSVDGLLPIHEAQLLSYLKLANKQLGYLINFNVPLIKQGFKRFVNGF
ncbi:MAG TPA: GxxExxY protein [Chryseolinea sp.]|nr:GxxExxY protein [Chryseolinea sp.]